VCLAITMIMLNCMMHLKLFHESRKLDVAHRQLKYYLKNSQNKFEKSLLKNKFRKIKFQF